MNRFFLAGAFLALSSGIVAAEDPLVREGTYFGSGDGGDVTVKLKAVGGGDYDASISTMVEGGCSGGVDGRMTFHGDTGVLSVPNPDYDLVTNSPLARHKACKVILTFNDEGFLQVDEKEGCLTFHGNACTFTGELVHESAVN
ncbi:hypothetical protein [Pseudomonas caspiana]|uniref:hypothetical protein n=1 Tax=Pseudomonas caspiana TaxID=1451454 RepID=UPI0032F01870